MAERAHPDDPLWRRRLLLFPTPALKYLVRRYKFCRPYVIGQNVLDVPCGNGMGFRFLNASSFLVGADASVEATGFALSRFGGHAGVTADMTRLPFKPGFFSVVICLEGIEHIDRDAGLEFLDEVSRILVPGGWLILSCPVLSEDRRHSGNEFHLYEWLASELVASVEALFEIEETRSIEGPAGDVLVIAAQGVESTRSEAKMARRAPDGRYESSIQRAAECFECLWVGFVARYCLVTETTLLATTFAVLASETLGSLAAWDAQRVAAIAAGIRQQQDEETGLFGGHLVRDSDLLAQPICDRQYLVDQITYFCLAALSALGSSPQHPLHFAQCFLDSDHVRKHIDDGPWHDVWNQSNRVMFVLRYLIHLMDEPDLAAKAHSVFDTVLSDIEKRQDPETGLWFGEGGRDHRLGVYAAYHFVPFFLWRGLPLERVDNMIDSVLGIQTAEGLFAESIGGGACEDLDAIDLLVKLSGRSDHRSEDIRYSLRRAFNRILQLQCDDGGFPNYLRSGSAPSWKRQFAARLGLSRLLERWRPTPTELTHYSGWTRVSVRRGEPDAWGTWFRSLALNLIVARLPELGTLPPQSRFHGLPALGWHDQDMFEGSAAGNRSLDSGSTP